MSERLSGEVSPLVLKLLSSPASLVANYFSCLIPFKHTHTPRTFTGNSQTLEFYAIKWIKMDNFYHLHPVASQRQTVDAPTPLPLQFDLVATITSVASRKHSPRPSVSVSLIKINICEVAFSFSSHLCVSPL